MKTVPTATTVPAGRSLGSLQVVALSPLRAACLPLIRTVVLPILIVDLSAGVFWKEVPGGIGIWAGEFWAVLSTVAAGLPMTFTSPESPSLSEPLNRWGSGIGTGGPGGAGTITMCVSTAITLSLCLAAGCPMPPSRHFQAGAALVEVDRRAGQLHRPGGFDVDARVALEVQAARGRDLELALALDLHVAGRRHLELEVLRLQQDERVVVGQAQAQLRSHLQLHLAFRVVVTAAPQDQLQGVKVVGVQRQAADHLVRQVEGRTLFVVVEAADNDRLVDVATDEAHQHEVLDARDGRRPDDGRRDRHLAQLQAAVLKLDVALVVVAVAVGAVGKHGRDDAEVANVQPLQLLAHDRLDHIDDAHSSPPDRSPRPPAPPHSSSRVVNPSDLLKWWVTRLAWKVPPRRSSGTWMNATASPTATSGAPRTTATP